MNAPAAPIVELTPPTPLRGGANGLRFAADGTLWVAQAMASKLSAVDPAGRVLAGVGGGGMLAPDDLAFDSRGTMYVTDVMGDRVLARDPGGSVRPIAVDVPSANGISVHADRIFMSEYRQDGRILEVHADGSAPRVIASGVFMPNALCLGPDGRLYFPLVPLGEVWRVGLDGSGLERVTGGLQHPTAVKFDDHGQLCVVEAKTGGICRIDPETGLRTEIARVDPCIDNLAFAPDGRIFVSRFIDGSIDEVDGERTRCFVAGGLLSPLGMTVDRNGALLIADGLSIARIDRAGRFDRLALRIHPGFPGYVRGIAAAADGSLRTTNSAGEVAHYVPGGEGTRILADGLDRPIGVAIDRDGACLICEAGAGRIVRIDADGMRSIVARGLARPTGIHVLDDGGLLVSEADAGRVDHIDGGAKSIIATGLDDPHGVTVAGGIPYVLDRGARTLLRLSTRRDRPVPVATGLPVGGAGPAPRDGLPGIPGLLAGPLCPFADICALPDGGVAIGGDAAGTVLKVGPFAPAPISKDR